MNAARTALIIGSGIAGPVTAMALGKAGIESKIYEAYPVPADGVGVTLTIAPNGLDALQIIGADEAVRSIGQPMTRTVMNDGYGERIGEFPGLTGLPPSLALWREQLSLVLHDLAELRGIPTEYGKRLVDVDESADGVTARFSDGTTASADILVGTDGIRSRTRELIDPNAPKPKSTPLLNFGAAADIAVPADPDAMYFVFGKRAFFGYWVQPDGRTAWFSNLPHDGPMSSRQAREVSNAEWRKRLLDIYADDKPGRDVIEHTSPENLVALGSMESMPKVPNWHRGRLVLVGDSAHAPSSSSGQGASMAIESAIQLARCLRDLPDVESAFAAYVDLRRSRAEKVIVRGARTNSGKTVGTFGKAMMRITLPLMMKTFLNPEKQLGPEQRYHIDWDEPVRPGVTTGARS